MDEDDDSLGSEVSRLAKITCEPVRVQLNAVRAGEDIRIPVNAEMIIHGELDGPWESMEGPLIVESTDKVTERQAVRLAVAC